MTLYSPAPVHPLHACAGKSTADQLWRIMRCLGPLTPSHTARLLADPRLRGFTVPPLHKTLRQRLPELEPRLFQLVEACLCPEPRHRPTAAELLAFPYFWDVPQLVAGTPFASLYGGGVPEAAAGGQGVAAASKAQQPAAAGTPAAVATAPAAVQALEPAADTPVGVSSGWTERVRCHAVACRVVHSSIGVVCAYPCTPLRVCACAGVGHADVITPAHAAAAGAATAPPHAAAAG